MSVDKLSVSSPQSSAGILGISANTNLHGWKIDPKVAVVFMVAFIVVVKLLDMLLA
ncbi:preprotein translocase subunit Sec61beta [Candidatus Micrarchaeota archaeon]|nr:preprotein translocase subunit Sec61beta [Candidatus Micrarchaeota archaeon]